MAGPNSIQGLLVQKVPNRTSLKVHPGAVPYSIDFSTLASPQNIDLSAGGGLKNQLQDVRSIYVDNSNNAASLSVTMQVTRQVLTWPAFSQGYLQCAATTPQFQISTSGDVLVGFDFFNIEIDNFLWSPSGAQTIGSVLFSGSAGVDHSVNAGAYPPGGFTLKQTVAANNSRALIGVQNQSADQVKIFRYDGVSNRTLIDLESGGGADIGGGAWTSQTFKGALEVWVPTANAGTDQVSVYED